MADAGEDSSGRSHSPSPSPTKSGDQPPQTAQTAAGSTATAGGGEQQVKQLNELRTRLRSETLQRESIAAELMRLRQQLAEVESRELASTSHHRRQVEALEVQLRDATRERDDAARQLQAAHEQEADIERRLRVEREKAAELQKENQRILIEQQDNALHSADIEETNMRLRQLEAENRNLTKKLEEASARADHAREAQREAARNAIEIQEKLEAVERRMNEESKRKQILADEVAQLRADLKQARQDAAERMTAERSVPRLSLQSFRPDNNALDANDGDYTARRRGDSVTFVNFNRGHEMETPRAGYSNDDTGVEMTMIPTTTSSSHRRSNSLDSLASQSVPLTEAPDGKMAPASSSGSGGGGGGGRSDGDDSRGDGKKKDGCPCVIC